MLKTPKGKLEKLENDFKTVVFSVWRMAGKRIWVKNQNWNKIFTVGCSLLQQIAKVKNFHDE